MPTPQEALAMFMRSPGIRNSTANLDTSAYPGEGGSYLAQRQADIYSGVDNMVPGADSAEVRAAQDQLGGSRAGVRESALAKVRAMLKMEADKNEAALQREVVPAQIKGQYDLQAANANAEASFNRMMAQQSAQDQRMQAQIEGALQRANIGAAAQTGVNNARQSATTGRDATQQIAAQRAALEKEIAKTAPGAIGRFFNKANPQADRLSKFDAAVQAAQEIARDYPTANAQEALAQMGANLPPDAVGQIQNMLMLLRGHP